MKTHIDSEIETCLAKMDKVKSKILELQREKKEQEAVETLKKNNIQPNMELFENWIKTYKSKTETEKQFPNDDAIKHFIRDKEDEIKNIKHNIKYGNKWYMNKDENEINEDEIEITPDNFPDCEKYKNLTQVIPNFNTMKKTFNSKSFDYDIKPNEYMYDFIEAIYNIFQIQQKHIEELKSKLEKLLPDS